MRHVGWCYKMQCWNIVSTVEWDTETSDYVTVVKALRDVSVLWRVYITANPVERLLHEPFSTEDKSLMLVDKSDFFFVPVWKGL